MTVTLKASWPFSARVVVFIAGYDLVRNRDGTKRIRKKVGQSVGRFKKRAALPNDDIRVRSVRKYFACYVAETQ